MESAKRTAPWQVGHVTTEGRIAAAALAALAINSAAFLSRSIPVSMDAFVVCVIPALVAIRVIRGFNSAPFVAAATFLAAGLLATRALAQLPDGHPAQLTAALIVTTALVGIGLGAIAAHWLATRRPVQPVIELLRWPSAPVALRSPSRYLTHRQYR